MNRLIARRMSGTQRMRQPLRSRGSTRKGPAAEGAWVLQKARVARAWRQAQFMCEIERSR